MTFDAQSLRLEKVLSFSNGRSSPARDEKDNISVYGSNGLIGYAAEANSSKNTIVIGRVGSYCGSVHFSKNSCWVTDNAIKATAKDDNDPFFLYYVLKHLNLNNWRSGSGQPLLNQATLNAIEALIPPPSAQRLISKLLCAIDDRITLLRETNQTLELIAQALFKSWFVDFDPVRAKAEGKLPEGIDEATAALFPDTFEETELGLVPKGWRYSTVQDSFVLTMGQSPPGSTYSTDNSDMPFYQGCTDFGFRFPTQRMYCSAPTRLAETGDTLVSVRAPVGDVNMAIEKCCIGRGLASVRHPNFQSFTFYAISNLGKHFKNFDTEGTIFGSINKADFQSLPVIDAPLNVVTEFENIAKQLDSKVVQNEHSLRVLSELRDTLLPRLISGQLPIADAETELEKAIA